MNLFDVVIFGIVEGITEFLPVSSTGHLMLAGRLLGLVQNDFLKSFEITIQLGAIAAVVVLYGKVLLRDSELLKRVIIAFLPTAVVGVIFYHTIHIFLGNVHIVVWSLFLGGLFLIIFERFYREEKEAVSDPSKMSYRSAFLIGLFQSAALIPGVSRAAATIIGGLILGLKRKAIVEFSFLLAIPTMLAAVGFDLIRHMSAFSSDQFKFLSIGFLTSFIVAMFAVKFLLHFIRNHNFIAFGIYRIVAAALFWFFCFR